MKTRIYLAGSFTDESNWRESISRKLEEKFGENVIAIDPFKREVDENNPRVKIGHDLYCVKNCDCVFVNAINSKVTMGTAQEIILAKYWGKFVIIVADDKAGITFKKRTSKTGVEMKNYIHPFADNFCDYITNNYNSALEAIKDLLEGKLKVKSFQQTLKPEKEYEKKVLPTDTPTQKAFKD